jgi:hypothetical protein
MPETARPRRRRPLTWRRLNNILHRDLGYLAVALTVIYAISGIAVNHTHQWNPSYRIVEEERFFTPFPATDRAAIVTTLVDVLELPGPPQNAFRRTPTDIELFYDGWSVRADIAEGHALVEQPRDRLLLRDMNFLHLNHPKGLWTWFADLYAVVLLVLAVTGMFVLRGRQGLAGRGKWFVLAGLVVPIVFLAALRWFSS